MRRTELVSLLTQQGELEEAQALCRENRASRPASGGKLHIAGYLEALGSLKVALGAPEAAARLWGAAEALRDAIGAPMLPIYRGEQALAVAAACTQSGEAVFAAAWVEGRQLTPEAALNAAD